MDERRRAAAVIVRDGRVLMVHERSRRSGGGEWWTLPGGGLRPGETAEEALRREVFEETGLVVSDARYVLEMPYPSGMTSVFAVTVADGEPRVGRDDGFGPEQLGVDWLPVPELPIETNGVPVPPLMVVLPTLPGQTEGAESASGSLASTAGAGAGRGAGGDVTARRRSSTK
ncbi:NUDIX hydrolase [Actinoplanes sichuanensis]|uniref:NUDIX domain-containing protein n=1 Tax=Actinoplanes sichuanensis TaxID=512349 RepID=A0ABW4A9M9_9ACTN|nr:NUDIX hydrolase [Actinoplanes sichuanensis]